MVELYAAACEVIRKGVNLQNSYDDQLLGELQWRVEREREAQAAKQPARRNAKVTNSEETVQAVQPSDMSGALATISSTGKTFGALIHRRFATCAIQGIICRAVHLLEGHPCAT